MPKITIAVMLAFVAFLYGQSNQEKPKASTKGGDQPKESPEHAVARSKYEVVKQQYEHSKAEYSQKSAADSECKVFPELIRHPITSSSVDDYTVGCAYETKRARYIMDKMAEYLEQYDIQLRDVDKCVAVYHATIDKKVSDQTTREVDEIKMCKAEDLYPPETK